KLFLPNVLEENAKYQQNKNKESGKEIDLKSEKLFKINLEAEKFINNDAVNNSNDDSINSLKEFEQFLNM
ncbi:7904_t:CDS:1, partial [Cetraspora pellucida]